MRLVDAEDLMRCITKEYNRRRTGDGLRLAWIEKAVNDAPTVSPDMAQVLAYECGKAERKRGRWEQVANDDNGIDFRCSACHRYRFHNGEMIKKYKFCPNCGADMRKGEE